MNRFIHFVVVFACLLCVVPVLNAQENREPVKIGWIMDSRGLGDGGFNDAVDKALTELAEKDAAVIIRAPRRELFTDQALYGLLELNVDVILASDENGMTGMMSEAARENPSVMFILVGAEGAPLTNLASVVFEEDEAGYMAGYIAGIASGNKTVGFIGGAPFDTIARFEKGFLGGVSDAGANAAVEYVSGERKGNALYDQNRTKEITRILSAKGVDVIFSASGPGSIGALEGAKERHISTVGLKNNLATSYPETVLASVVYRFDVPIKKLALDAFAGSFFGGLYVMNFANGGLDVVPTPGALALDKIKNIEAKKKMVAEGKVRVPDYFDERRRKTLVVAYTGGNPPYEYANEEGEPVGYTIDVMDEVGKRLKREVVSKSFFFMRLDSGLEETRSDIRPMVVLDEGNVDIYSTTESWGVFESVIVVSKEGALEGKISELMSKKVGVLAGSHEARYLLKVRGVFLELYSTLELALIELGAGSIDAVIGDREAIFHLLSGSLKKKEFVVGEKPVLISPYSVGAPGSSDAALLLEIDRALGQMKEDGTIEKLRDKWFR